MKKFWKDKRRKHTFCFQVQNVSRGCICTNGNTGGSYYLNLFRGCKQSWRTFSRARSQNWTKVR